VAVMARHQEKSVVHFRWVCAGALALAMCVGLALAQEPQQPRPPNQENAAAPGDGGLVDAFGRWIKDSVNNWNTGVKGAADVATDVAKGAADVATDVAKGAADAATTVTRETADAVARIPTARFVNAREVCPVAPNGAPDCRAAAETICKAHGFSSGSSADFQTYQKCPPIALNRADGGPPPPCTIESAVTRALCQ
jgi:hypothetical protein